jgi:hypothetical protein
MGQDGHFLGEKLLRHELGDEMNNNFTILMESTVKHV